MKIPKAITPVVTKFSAKDEMINDMAHKEIPYSKTFVDDNLPEGIGLLAVLDILPSISRS
jgi:hypothetical protein